jgi:hypothetical protein
MGVFTTSLVCVLSQVVRFICIDCSGYVISGLLNTSAFTVFSSSTERGGGTAGVLNVI